MDAATEPTWTYLRRPPQPDPPRHPTVARLLTLTLIRRVQGAALPNPLQHPCPNVASIAAPAGLDWRHGHRTRPRHRRLRPRPPGP
ncbi:hypothetical protein B9Y85_04635 [Stenotrophomonas maltophilia]|nr:hypothetical protein B9Y57_06110 [Stenotrophomonas maltophilia]PJL30091.1 hypothetical protein B9Y65_06110 [Stenotrophomonas maltophilia]PJL69788.1 hypothetical protein B9Y85_04635 [Stenotrophomonas maltophilia]